MFLQTKKPFVRKRLSVRSQIHLYSAKNGKHRSQIHLHSAKNKRRMKMDLTYLHSAKNKWKKEIENKRRRREMEHTGRTRGRGPYKAAPAGAIRSAGQRRAAAEGSSPCSPMLFSPTSSTRSGKGAALLLLFRATTAGSSTPLRLPGPFSWSRLTTPAPSHQ